MSKESKHVLDRQCTSWRYSALVVPEGELDGARTAFVGALALCLSPSSSSSGVREYRGRYFRLRTSLHMIGTITRKYLKMMTSHTNLTLITHLLLGRGQGVCGTYHAITFQSVGNVRAKGEVF